MSDEQRTSKTIVASWITHVWGERCPHYDPNCTTCRLWTAFDDPDCMLDWRVPDEPSAAPIDSRGVVREPFVVKHYEGDAFPTIKGNGFDGLQVGEDRREAEEFISWINARLSVPPVASPHDLQRLCSAVLGNWKVGESAACDRIFCAHCAEPDGKHTDTCAVSVATRLSETKSSAPGETSNG